MQVLVDSSVRIDYFRGNGNTDKLPVFGGRVTNKCLRNTSFHCETIKLPVTASRFHILVGKKYPWFG